MTIAVITAAAGASWETGFVVGLSSGEHGATVVRRCVDVLDLLAVAGTGQARVVLVSAELAQLDVDIVDRLAAAGVVPVGVLPRSDEEAEQRLNALGIAWFVPADASPAVLASVLCEAVARGGAAHSGDSTRAFATLGAAPGGPGWSSAPTDDADWAEPTGRVIAVWGPTGAPGRTTVALAVADELSRLGSDTVLIDADVYGGVIATMLGLLDESPGLAAACRIAGTRRLGPAALAGLCWQLTPTWRVLTGLPRADRWPELRVSGLSAVLSAARSLARFVVLDCGFCLENDEELSYDTIAPRRNGVTLTALDDADLILAVGAADPIGLQRLVRGLSELRDAEVSPPVWTVLNKVRRSVVPGDPAAEASAALQRFAGVTPVATLPWDPAGLDQAARLGRTIAEARPSSPLRTAVRQLAGLVQGPASAADRAAAASVGRRRRSQRG